MLTDHDRAILDHAGRAYRWQGARESDVLACAVATYAPAPRPGENPRRRSPTRSWPRL
jgi:hypothetical protein